MAERRKEKRQEVVFVMPIVSAFDTPYVQLISYDKNADHGII